MALVAVAIAIDCVALGTGASGVLVATVIHFVS